VFIILKKIFICVFFIFLFFSFPSASYSKWEEGIPLPKAKSGTSAAIINKNIIVIGGKSIIGNHPLSEIFDIEGQIWRPISIFPKELHSFRIVNFGTNIFLCGGHDGKKITNKCWIYDDILSNWAEINPMPYARAEHIMVKIDKKIYILGGLGEKPEIVMSYDLISRNWEYNFSKFLNPVYSSGFAAFDKKIAIIGGIRIQSGKIMNEFTIYDPKLDKWEKYENYPLDVASPSVQQIGNNLHVVGGKLLNPNKTYDNHFSFVNDRWITKESLPTPRHDMSSAFFEGKWFLIGGAISPGIFSLFSPTDVVEIYQEK